jgi:hypothetical protein
MLRWFSFPGPALLSLVLATNALAGGEGPADPKLDLNANAALKYWRGFANLPKLEKEEQDKIVREATTMPLTPRVKAVVTLSELSLHELYNGAAVPACAWGLTREDGFTVILPEASAARLLEGLACLRARLRFEEGDNPGALDDVFAGMTLARHIGQDGTIVAVLVGFALESMATDVLAAYLPTLDTTTLQTLPARLSKLPAGGTVAKGLLSEETVFLGGFQARVREFKNREKLAEYLGLCLSQESGETKKEQLARGKAYLEECGGTAEGLLKLADEARPLYEELAKKTALPPDEFAKLMEVEGKRIEKNPVARIVFPVLVKCHRLEARLLCRRALLSAALAIQLGGREALKAHPDPYGNGLFVYEAFDGGYVLQSKLQFKEKPVSLTVGKRE